LGYAVLHELRKREGGAWTRIAGPSADVSSFSVALLDGTGKSTGASGLYRVTTLLVPDNDLSITNELPTTNIVGVLEIASGKKNTMTAVPFKGLATDPASPRSVAVSDLVALSLLSANDKIFAMADGVYHQWKLSSDGWVAAAATAIKIGGLLQTVTTPPAAESLLARNQAVWVVREDASKPFFLIGQYSDEAVTVPIAAAAESKGCTMLSNPHFQPLVINSLDWGGGPAAGDVIQIPGAGNLQWDATNRRWWRTAVTVNPVTRRVERGIKTDDVIPAGQGVWYYRASPGAFSVTIPRETVDE